MSEIIKLYIDYIAEIEHLRAELAEAKRKNTFYEQAQEESDNAYAAMKARAERAEAALGKALDIFANCQGNPHA